MNQRIIYQTDAGGVAVIVPAPNVRLTIAERAQLDGVSEGTLLQRGFDAGMTPEEFVASLVMTVEEIAAKDVPTGKPFAIIDVADVPTDRTLRDEWTIDVADLTDGVGA